MRCQISLRNYVFANLGSTERSRCWCISNIVFLKNSILDFSKSWHFWNTWKIPVLISPLSINSINQSIQSIPNVQVNIFKTLSCYFYFVNKWLNKFRILNHELAVTFVKIKDKFDKPHSYLQYIWHYNCWGHSKRLHIYPLLPLHLLGISLIFPGFSLTKKDREEEGKSYAGMTMAP